MEEKHKYTQPIINSMKTLLKGDVSFSENYSKWIVKVNVKWNKKEITININSRKTDLKSNFLSCSLTRAQFLSFLFRFDAYNFSGTKSKYSELLLKSVETQYLMDSKKPLIKLHEKSLIFAGRIRKKDIKSLSNVFLLFETLMQEIDSLNEENNN